MPDGVLKPVREIIKNNDGEFPLESIVERFKGTNRALNFTEDDINNLLTSKYGQGDTLVKLSKLYPWADLRNNFHVDHIFPKSTFTQKKLIKKGVPVDKTSEFIEKCNYIGNLQLLEDIPNIEKSNTDFDVWLNNTVSASALSDYKRKHFIPDVDLSFKNFDCFFQEREKLLMKALITSNQIINIEKIFASVFHFLLLIHFESYYKHLCSAYIFCRHNGVILIAINYT